MSNYAGEIVVGSFFAAGPVSLPASSAQPGSTSSSGRYESMPSWGDRRWDAATTDRLNQAHWQYAQDESLNAWLSAQLPALRGRAAYEVKNNGMLLGMISTHADDIVGRHGPSLQVISDNEAYNEALEEQWRQWFYAPTHLPNMSGAALLKLWVRSLWKQGAFLAQIITDDNATTPIKMRLRPMHSRRLGTPAELATNPRIYNGVEFDQIGRPIRYYVKQQEGIGTGPTSVTTFDPIPSDLIIHEYLYEEEDQGAGVPWLASALQSSADLRDYDDQIQDAARLMADSAVLLYTRSPDAPVWTSPESMEFQRRQINMAPPQWEPWQNTASQPPVQYPDYRGERMREFGRPVGMPLMLIRLDASGHNYSSARFDSQVYDRAVEGIQTWLSGSDSSYGTLNRLLDEVAREAKFAVPELRNRPDRVTYEWTWPRRPHVDPSKEAKGEQISLEAGTTTEIDVLAANGTTLETHIAKKKRVVEAYAAAGLPAPTYKQQSVDQAPEETAEEAAQNIEDDKVPE